ncbi:SDR family NAD(P)-dependent oxidoreductase [Flagellimonas sp. 2504JD4-2]
MTSFSYKGKGVLITGGGSGIGKSLSWHFARQGAQVYILDHNFGNATDVAMDIQVSGLDAQAFQCDVSNQYEVKKTIEKISSVGDIDVLINNAGIAHIGDIEDTSEDDMDRLYQVNIKGVYNCTRAVIKNMKKRNSGVILNMASIASSVGISDRFAYSMTKGAVLTMTYSIAKDYINHGIRCNCISPARVHTPFVDGFISKNYPGKEKEMFRALSKTQPIGRMANPDEIASLAIFLCSNEASFITGSDFPIDGGFIKLNG